MIYDIPLNLLQTLDIDRLNSIVDTQITTVETGTPKWSTLVDIRDKLLKQKDTGEYNVCECILQVIFNE